MPGKLRASRYSSTVGLWSVSICSQMVGYTQLGRRQVCSALGFWQFKRYILAVGPPKSDITPVKPGTLSRISLISCIMDSFDRLWITRPSCSVIEQNEQPPKQPRIILTE